MTWTGHELQALQAELTLTVEAFAWLLGISQATIYRWYGCGRDEAPASGASRHVLAIVSAWAKRGHSDAELAQLRAVVIRQDTLAAFELLTSQIRKAA